jgi:hypothetical protein
LIALETRLGTYVSDDLCELAHTRSALRAIFSIPQDLIFGMGAVQVTSSRKGARGASSLAIQSRIAADASWAAASAGHDALGVPLRYRFLRRRIGVRAQKGQTGLHAPETRPRKLWARLIARRQLSAGFDARICTP